MERQYNRTRTGISVRLAGPGLTAPGSLSAAEAVVQAAPQGPRAWGRALPARKA